MTGGRKDDTGDPPAPFIPSFSDQTLIVLTSLYLRPRVSGETDSTPNQDESRSTEATYSGPIPLIWVDLGIGLCAMLAHERRRWLGRHLPMRL